MPYKGPALCGRRAGTVLPAGSGSNVCKCRTMVKNKFYICINRAEPPLRPQVSEGGGSAHAPAMGIAEEGAKGRRRQKTGSAEGKRRERGEEGEGKRPFCLPHAGFVREEGEKGRVGRREGEEGGEGAGSAGRGKKEGKEREAQGGERRRGVVELPLWADGITVRPRGGRGRGGGTARLFSAGSVPGKPCTGRGGGAFCRTGLPPVRERRRGKRSVRRRSPDLPFGPGGRGAGAEDCVIPASCCSGRGCSFRRLFSLVGTEGGRMSATLRPAGCAGESFPSCGQGKGGRVMPKRAPLGNVGGKVPE